MPRTAHKYIYKDKIKHQREEEYMEKESTAVREKKGRILKAANTFNTTDGEASTSEATKIEGKRIFKLSSKSEDEVSFVCLSLDDVDSNLKMPQQSGTTFPIILIVDGHSEHQTLKISQVCTELQIILIALYPNATRLMQPANVAAFKPLKTRWEKAVLEFRRKNPSQVLTKERFAPVLKTVVEEYAKVDTIKNGFRASDPSTTDTIKNKKENKKNYSLSDYIVWPKTPEWKGEKETKRLLFMLTSSNWKKLQIEKLELKKQEQKRKKTRKTERLLKHDERTTKIMEEKRVTRTEKELNEKTAKQKSKLQIKKSKILTNNAGRLEHQVENFSSLQPSVSRWKKTAATPNTSAVRRLFIVEEMDNKLLEQFYFLNNVTAEGNFCYSCTYNINVVIRGVRCYGCVRTYHNKCKIKMDPNIDNLKEFYCKVCLSKENAI
ncbi:hypothetical protein ILUMI_07665 [Ignelater luminosus]|uniref:DDE-1 domain-containing protein n=1 Tax=Ignelater luminosus TaxID=2038154 RepID=A0A8K0DD03_IGNLU|nr:hypothetical protein ILUMI_07665 [Ignelater luminosus]